MNFPIRFKKQPCQPGDQCDYCQAKPNSPEFVSLALGVMQDYAAASVVDLAHTSVLMGLDWQGSSDKQGCGFQVVDDTVDGQCVLNFCSPDCLRRFLNGCVDHLESLIQNTKQQ